MTHRTDISTAFCARIKVQSTNIRGLFYIVFVPTERDLRIRRMALADNSKNLRVDRGGRLSGETKLGNGTWSHHMIDLHPKFGNDDGRFDIKGSNFAWGAEDLRMDGTTLRARLKNRAGHFVEASIDLGRILKVKDGEFVFMTEFVYFLLLCGKDP